MPARKYMTTRERPNAIRLMVADTEKKELQRAAKKLDTPLSKFMRDAALEKARQING